MSMFNLVCVCVCACVCFPYLPLPNRINGIADDAWSLLLAVVRQGREDAVLAGVDGDLQVGVRVKEHAFL